MTDSADPPSVDFATKERAMDEAPVGITISDPAREDNPLVYVNEAFEEVTGYDAAMVLGENCRLLQGEDTDPAAVEEFRDAIEAGESVTVELLNYREDGERFWNEVTIAPLRNEEGTITNFVGFQNDVTRRKEAEFALKDERARLDRLLDRVDGLLDAVTEAIVMATTRADLERTICDRLVAMEAYEAAWIGHRDAASETISPETWATSAAEIDEAEPPAVAFDSDHPAAIALDRSAAQIVETNDGADGWPASGDNGTVVAVPLQYRDGIYGVLTVVAQRSAAIEERELTVFTGLGRTIGAAMSVLESRRILTADTVIDVELQLTDERLFFLCLADAADCTLEYVGSVVRPSGSALFFTVEGASGDGMEAAARSCPGVESLSVLADREGACRIEVEPNEDSIVGRLAEYGAQTKGLVAADGRATIQFSLPENADVRSIYERVRDRYPGTTLLSTTQRQRTPETRGEYIERIEDRLTERQRTALETAYAAGYFDRPRHVTGDELADAMGVGRSTFHQHLRAAERKLLAAFFDR